MQFYTLEQAAQVLRTTPDKVKEMARRGELRAFQDRGTMRFRSQEVDEKARALNAQSDVELPLGEAPPAKPAGGPSSSARRKSPSPSKTQAAPAMADDAVPLGADPPPDKTGSRGGSSKRPSPSPQSSKKPSGLHRDPAKASGDSDVRLVLDGSDLDFRLDLDEPPPAPPSPPPGPKSSARRSSKVDPAKKGDSSARVLPLDADSDVKIIPDERGHGDSKVPLDPAGAKRPSDSDIRLEGGGLTGADERPRPGQPITEEIDLDAEKAQFDLQPAQPKQKPRPKSKAHPQPQPPLPTESPFELSESELDVDKPKGKRSTLPLPEGEAPRTPKPEKKSPEDQDVDSSSDFELTVGTDEHAPVETGSDEIPLLDDSDEVGLGELSGPAAGKSGINLQEPADSGISLEAGKSDEIEFELSLDEKQATPSPKPAPAEHDVDESSSEFELTLDDSSPQEEEASSSDSEFELSLDVDSSSELSVVPSDEGEESSDSEFELTLDEDSADAMEVAEGDALAADEGEKDIFETDFEVPALDEESGSEAVALDEESDTDLESSDFELQLSDDEMEPDAVEESGSEVVALDDEEQAEPGAETVARVRQPRKTAARRSKVVVEEEEEGLDIDLDEEEPEVEVDEEEAPARAAAAAAAPPAEWGALPGVLLIFSAIFLFVAGLMGYELVQNMTGYQRGTAVSAMVIDPLAKMIDPDGLKE